MTDQLLLGQFILEGLEGGCLFFFFIKTNKVIHDFKGSEKNTKHISPSFTDKILNENKIEK